MEQAGVVDYLVVVHRTVGSPLYRGGRKEAPLFRLRRGRRPRQSDGPQKLTANNVSITNGSHSSERQTGVVRLSNGKLAAPLRSGR